MRGNIEERMYALVRDIQLDQDHTQSLFTSSVALLLARNHPIVSKVLENGSRFSLVPWVVGWHPPAWQTDREVCRTTSHHQLDDAALAATSRDLRAGQQINVGGHYRLVNVAAVAVVRLRCGPSGPHFVQRRRATTMRKEDAIAFLQCLRKSSKVAHCLDPHVFAIQEEDLT